MELSKFAILNRAPNYNNGARFESIMRELGELLNKDDIRNALEVHEECDIKAKFGLFAVDKLLRPEVYQRIYEHSVKFPENINEYYGWKMKPGQPNRRPVALVPKWLPKEMIAEEYRLPMEYYLFAPNREKQFAYRRIETVLLLGIRELRNEKSIQALEELIEWVTPKNASSNFTAMRNRYYQTLAFMPSARSLTKLLDAIDMPGSPQKDESMTQSIFDNMTGRRTVESFEPSPDRYKAWREIISAYPRDNLPSTQAEFLDRVLDAPAPEE